MNLGYHFQNPALLELAFSHESFVNEREGARSNERLEFLGDSVLGLVVAETLYRNFPDEPEGRLAQMKSYLVSTEHLADRARELGLGEAVQLGRGEQQSRDRASLLADTFEAVIGAIYLDGGFGPAAAFIERQLAQSFEQAGETRKDYKTLLQEFTQKEFRILPDYQVVLEEGAPHDKTFEVQVHVLKELLGSGVGRSKREASQRAAHQALERLQEDAELFERLSQVDPGS